MSNRVLAAVLALSLLQAAPCVTAQTQNPAQPTINTETQDWQKLRDLKPDKKILIELKGGSTVKGKLKGLAPGKLTLSDDGNIYVLKQRDIQRVYRLKGGWSRARLMRIGAVVGFLVGGEIGFRREFRLEQMPNRIPSDKDEIPTLVGLSLGSLAGIGLGALFGRGTRRGQLLYEAK
jgi:hypothetical protein